MTGGIVLASCHRRGSGDETKMTTGTTETTGTGDITDVKAEELPADKPVTLSGAGGNITLSSDGKRLLIDGMSTAAGKNVVSGGSEYSLPYIIKRDSKSYEAEWELSGISERNIQKRPRSHLSSQTKPEAARYSAWGSPRTPMSRDRLSL